MIHRTRVNARCSRGRVHVGAIMQRTKQRLRLSARDPKSPGDIIAEALASVLRHALVFQQLLNALNNFRADHVFSSRG